MTAHGLIEGLRGELNAAVKRIEELEARMHAVERRIGAVPSTWEQVVLDHFSAHPLHTPEKPR
ncbi:MAG TPA: hypothetical protein VEA41_02175 [Salinarimonas sp.]|nr:hypothetical protein [Salinarimonas sp.]